jgi:lysozyme
MKERWSLLWAARFVAKWEGFIPTAYLDTIASPPVWTIGYGHTNGVRAGQTVSEGEARKLLAADLRDAARAVGQEVKVKLTVRQRIALISIVFNCGPGVLDDTHLIKDLNAGNYEGAADRFLEWDHAGGVRVEGLTNRRKSERWMFLHDNSKAKKVDVTSHAQLSKARKSETAVSGGVSPR